MDFLRQIFGSGDFMPHGYCYLWNARLVWLHIISDSQIALSYFSIPVTLFWFVHKRRDLQFSWIFVHFGMFIVACGTTHGRAGSLCSHVRNEARHSRNFYHRLRRRFRTAPPGTPRGASHASETLFSARPCAQATRDAGPTARTQPQMSPRLELTPFLRVCYWEPHSWTPALVLDR